MIATEVEKIYAAEAKKRQAEYHGNQYDKKENGLAVNLPQHQKDTPESEQKTDSMAKP